MSRQAIRLRRTGSLPRAMTETTDWTPHRDISDLLMLGAFQRNVYAGGGFIDLDVSVRGGSNEIDLAPWFPIGIDNSNSQISGFSNTNGGTLVVQFRFLVQVSDGSVSVTPRVYDITAAAAATTSGAVACTATSLAFTGSNQQQTLALTLPAALHYFKPQIVIGGSPGGSPSVTARVVSIFDCYISD